MARQCNSGNNEKRLTTQQAMEQPIKPACDILRPGEATSANPFRRCTISLGDTAPGGTSVAYR